MLKELKFRPEVRRLLLCLICLMLALALLAMLPPAAYAEQAEPQTLIVTVVEEIPADEIEDEDVPLAAFDDAGRGISDATRHVLLMCLLLMCVAVYVFYFSMFEKRLGALRLRAAEAEARWRETRRGEQTVRSAKP